MKSKPLISRLDVHIVPDSSRVVALLFVAGQELGGAESRASSVVKRIVSLPELDVKRRLKEVIQRFGRRHRDIVAVFAQHAERVSNRLDPSDNLSEERWLLLGASFTHEYSLEAAAVYNPSMVLHPDQTDVPEGSARFVMSFRAVGEGHRSSIGFRSGLVSAEGEVTLDERGPFPMIGAARDGIFHRDVFHARLKAMGQDGESSAYVLDELPLIFSIEELEARLEILVSEHDTRQDAHMIASQHRSIAACSYGVNFDGVEDISERVLWPVMAAESHGMEDARFVRFTEDDGSVTYLATYTAFDGIHISQQLLRTDDFVTFDASPVVGAASLNKGLALFPRRLDGHFAALTRYDRETNAVCFSDTLGHWGRAVTFQLPEWDWEVIQLGNCGSPIETDAGWLVLTHAVGPMRTYSIGAVLLDINDPKKMIASMKEPLITATPEEQDGYVPNVVYTCGAMQHGDVLVIPYGVADSRINFATLSIKELLASMVTAEHPAMVNKVRHRRVEDLALEH
ncbi:MAG TPA: glycoside hydrolase family 130 protein [Acidimicrobiales bacterium]